MESEQDRGKAREASWEKEREEKERKRGEEKMFAFDG